MIAKRIARVACRVLVSCFLIATLFRANEIGDAFAVFTVPFRNVNVRQSFARLFPQNANLAARCLLGYYDPDFVAYVAPAIGDWNPKRANELLNTALSQTEAGISTRSRFDILIALAIVNRRQKQFIAAEKFVREAMKGRPELLTPCVDDAVFCRVMLAEIEKDRKDFKKAEVYLDDAIDWEYLHLPNSPCMQEYLAELLERKAKIKELMNDHVEAAALRGRARAARNAARNLSISASEEVFIQKAHARLEPEVAAATPIDYAADSQTGQAPGVSIPKVSEKVMAELNQVRFPATCLVQDGPTYVGKNPDGVAYQTCNVKEGISFRTVFASGDPLGELNGAYVANDRGETFLFSPQHGNASYLKAGKSSSGHSILRKPGGDAAECRLMKETALCWLFRVKEAKQAFMQNP